MNSLIRSEANHLLLFRFCLVTGVAMNCLVHCSSQSDASFPNASTTFWCFFFFVDTKGLFVVSWEDMWNMSCIWCQDVHIPLPQPPPPCFINYSQLEFGQVGAKEPDGEKKGPWECCSLTQPRADARLRGPHQRLYALPRSCLQSAKEAARHPFP